MRLPRKDLIATGLVAVAVLAYLAWVFDVAGLSSVRVAGIVMLACGFVASANAVVPGFDGLLRGNKAYLVVTSLIGVAALVGGVGALVGASESGLGLLLTAIVVLWVIATVHHVRLASQSRARDPQDASPPRSTTTALTH